MPRQGHPEVLVVHPIGPGAGRYYADGPTGTWCGGGAEALGLRGPVGIGDLGALLHGRRPGGEVLGRAPRRRAGWDLTFAAPKGLSLVTGLLADSRGAALRDAHRSAVDEALGFATRHALWVNRSGPEGACFVAAGDGLVAARFEHTSTACGDPHLHSHVLFANVLLGPDGRWSAVASSPLWRSQREIGALYALGLRHHVAAAELDVTWVRQPGGGHDLDGVPRSAIEAASRRQAEIAAHQADGWSATGRRAARAVTRPTAVASTGWRDAVAAAGLDRAAADAVVRPRPPPDPTVIDDARIRAGLREASSFTVRDVLRALDQAAPAGMPADVAEERAGRFCAAAHPHPTRDGRWLADGADGGVAAQLGAARGRGAAVVAPRRARSAAGDRVLDDAGAATVRRLLQDGHAVEVVAGAPGADRLGAQAAVLDAARRAWQASGFRVAAVGAGRRWEPVAGLPAHDGSRTDVLVVDRADRLAPDALAHLVDRAATAGTKLVLVEGGTLPARRLPCCEALIESDRLDPGRLTGDRQGPGPVARTAGPSVAATGRGAVTHLVGVAERQGAILVGAGAAEARLLNDAARPPLGDRGPVLHAGGRAWQAGDRVIALRAERSERIPAGSLGTIDVVRPHGHGLGFQVAWDAGGRTWLPRHQAGLVGPGWATTPALAAAAGRDVVVLGEVPPADLSRDRVVEQVVVAPALVRDPVRHPDLDAAVAAARSQRGPWSPPPVDGPLSALRDERDRLAHALAADLPAGAADRPAWAAARHHDLARWDTLATCVEVHEDVAAHAATLDREVGRTGPDLNLGADRVDERSWRRSPALDLGLS